MKDDILQQGKSVYRGLWITSILGILITLIIEYISGSGFYNIYFRVSYWVFSLMFALLTYYICRVINRYSVKKRAPLIAYTAFIFPLIYTFDNIMVKNFNLDSHNILYHFFINLLYLIIQISVFFILIVSLRNIDLQSAISSEDNVKVQPEQFSDSDSNHSFILQEDEGRVLGRGNSLLDKVINSLLTRANNAGKTITASLIIMVALVVVGGGASFGTMALSEARKIRELEKERLRMIDIVDIINETPKKDAFVNIGDTAKGVMSKAETKYEAIKQLIIAKYGNTSSYKDTLESIEKKSNISWTDIALRVTIAALTLFLVQVFFHIYKYNQQQSSYLLTKAEILELYKEAGAKQDELRSVLLAKLDANPSFGEAPTTTTDKILDIITKVKDTK